MLAAPTAPAGLSQTAQHRRGVGGTNPSRGAGPSSIISNVSPRASLSSGAARFSSSSSSSTTLLLRRMLHFGHLDFEYAGSTAATLLLAPSKVNKLTQWRHEIKGTWSRDDPAFLFMLIGFTAAVYAAFSLALGGGPLMGVVSRVLFGWSTLLLGGGVVATITSNLCNAYFLTRHPHSVPQLVDWSVAFDAHCNAFLTSLCWLGFLQYLFLPLLVDPEAGAMMIAVGNGIWLAAALHYLYCTFLGFVHLPFVNKAAAGAFLSPVVPLVLGWGVTTLLRFNVAGYLLRLVFVAS